MLNVYFDFYSQVFIWTYSINVDGIHHEMQLNQLSPKPSIIDKEIRLIIACLQNLNNKIYKLKLQGTDFKFEEIEDPIPDSKKKARTLKLTDAMKVQKWSYIAIISFLVLFSGTILGFCHYVLCRKEK